MITSLFFSAAANDKDGGLKWVCRARKHKIVPDERGNLTNIAVNLKRLPVLYSNTGKIQSRLLCYLALYAVSKTKRRRALAQWRCLLLTLHMHVCTYRAYVLYMYVLCTCVMYTFHVYIYFKNKSLWFVVGACSLACHEVWLDKMANQCSFRSYFVLSRSLSTLQILSSIIICCGTRWYAVFESAARL